MTVGVKHKQMTEMWLAGRLNKKDDVAEKQPARFERGGKTGSYWFFGEGPTGAER